MAEQLLDDLRVDRTLQQNAGHRMAEVVDPDVRQTSGLQGARQGAVDLARLDRSPANISKDETARHPVPGLCTSVRFALPMREQALPGRLG